MSAHWTPTSWQTRTVAQDIVYEDKEGLQKALDKLAELPDLVPASEIDQLNQMMAFVAEGNAFLIQGGDCAEAFKDMKPELIKSKQNLLRTQADIIANGLGVPVVPIGRIAGQYSKPRSNPFETLADGRVVNAFRGENVNGMDEDDRTPNPERLLMGYHLAAVAMNVLRSGHQEAGAVNNAVRPSSDVYTSHEALHLPLEAALTHNGYNTGAHMLWIGERTRGLDGAHVEYMRGLKNPVGVKLGPTTCPKELIKVLDVLNPDKITGKNTLITRFGAKKVEQALPALIKAVQASGHKPVWICDPCHGNTVTTASKVKTRIYEDILHEIKMVHKVHLENGSRLGGIHLEETGEEDVTECIECSRTTLDTAKFPEYRTMCDPRLSGLQAKSIVREFCDFAATLDAHAKVSTPIATKGRAPRMSTGASHREALNQVRQINKESLIHSNFTVM